MTQPIGPQYPAYPQPVVPPKKKRLGLILGLIGGLLILACCGVGITALNSDSGKKGIADGASIAAPATTRASTAPATTSATKYVTPTVKDFTLKVRVTNKECFGSAGCNLKYRVYGLTYNGDTAQLDPSKSYELTYEVRGIEGGASVHSIETIGGQYTEPDEEFGSVSPSQGKKKAPLTVVVTEINEL